ncbi:DUF6263 family protein [Chryseobacterium chendengshani]|uniref:DUF6263 family protein n=1 Tax=Chryseobacterium sp. LJ756 TaxID=2864113 RepID=UPI001C63E5AE|nr:DUF6263 family protein [Chryseobacterium sp. LJ756]MBW7674436.1 hypothetical protein [Chryseobacterium sp. LJ756]
MKNYLYLFIALILVSCNSSQPKKMIFNPEKPRAYKVSLVNDKLDIGYEVQCSFKQNDGKVLMETELKNISFSSGSEMDAEINKEYQGYVGSLIQNTFDKKGHNESEVESQRIFNTELLVVEFPDKEIQIGDTWQGKKSAKPDMFFETILTKYKCIKISNVEMVIEVEMIFESENDDQSGFGKKMTRNYKGNYTVDNNGVVKSAYLVTSGFSGLSEITGKLQITEIK